MQITCLNEDKYDIYVIRNAQGKQKGGSQGPSCMYARGGEHSGAYRVQHGGWGGVKKLVKNVYVINGRSHICDSSGNRNGSEQDIFVVF